MICYLDRTFCSYYKECAEGGKCVCALTDEVEEKAKAFGLDICRFLEHPDCFVTVSRDLKNSVDNQKQEGVACL